MDDNPGKRDEGRLFHRQTLPGAMPGTLKTDPEAPRSVIQVMAWSDAELVEERVTDVDQLKAYVKKWPMAWVNVDGLGDADTLRSQSA